MHREDERQLELDTQWQRVVRMHELCVVIANLAVLDPPGRYRFKVIACFAQPLCTPRLVFGDPFVLIHAPRGRIMRLTCYLESDLNCGDRLGPTRKSPRESAGTLSRADLQEDA